LVSSYISHSSSQNFVKTGNKRPYGEPESVRSVVIVKLKGFLGDRAIVSRLLLTSCTILNNPFRAGSPAQPLLRTRKLNFCEARKPVIEHGAKCEFLQIKIT
jgi:hypothetical protein